MCTAFGARCRRREGDGGGGVAGLFRIAALNSPTPSRVAPIGNARQRYRLASASDRCRFLLPSFGPGYACRASSAPVAIATCRCTSGACHSILRCGCCARPFAEQKESTLSSFQSRAASRRKQLIAERAAEFRTFATWSEQVLWRAIRGGMLGVTFRRQAPVVRYGGRSLQAGRPIRGRATSRAGPGIGR